MAERSVRKLTDYDSEPVKYCPRCYSLRIGSIEGADDSDYCMDCGCSEVASASISEWEGLYEGRYGRRFVERNLDPERSRVYGLTLDGLKRELCLSPLWREIIHIMYPSFPGWLMKADSVILFFDKVLRDSRLGELKEVLVSETAKKTGDGTH